ncbi:MAG: glycosyltransferase [Candidatus Aegiribacteria sp.]|nr:glycosyltransferase [Candidatus Aegiribacteria sp.]MBD3294007.1 glycosyltransferase [Candidatus Fermentibacteria bacterium]
MHVLTDARAVQKYVDGISRYSIGVLKALAALRPEWRITAMADPSALPLLKDLNIEAIESRVPRFKTGENRKLSPVIEEMEPDVYFNFSMAGPTPGVPTMLAVHDLMVLTVPGYFGNFILKNILAKLVFRFQISRSVHHASSIPVLSEASLKDLKDTFPDSWEKGFVAGAGQDLFDGSETLPAERKDFILYVGNARAYKNLTRLIVAYSRLRAMDSSFPEMKMVVRRDRAYGRFVRELDDSFGRDGVTVLSAISDSELKELYRTCSFLVIPSIKEGFGLPALEAMAAGAPVVGSRGTSLEEIMGDAGILVNPESVTDIMRGMALARSSPELRQEMGESGPARASGFTWERTGSILAERISEMAQ